MKTYGWQSPEQLKFINENPKVLSLLYDLSILPEEISARVRGIVEGELKESNRLNREMKAAWDKWMKECFCDHSHFSAVDCPHVREARRVFDAVVEKPKGEEWAICGWCSGNGMDYGNAAKCPKCLGAGGKAIEKRVDPSPKCDHDHRPVKGGGLGVCQKCGDVYSL